MNEELLNNFNDLVGRYRTHREYIERAQKQAEKFSSAVVEKVILDHEIKASQVADELLPLVPQLEEDIGTIDAEVGSIEADKVSSDEKMEELELRMAIGELSDDGFADESKDLKSSLDEWNARLETLSGERSQLQGGLDAWVELATSAGQDSGVSAAADEAADSEEEEGDADGDDPEPEGPQPQIEPDDGQHSSIGGIKEDVSAVFNEQPSNAAVAVAVGGEAMAIEAGEGESGDEPSADVDFGFDEDGEEEVAGAEVELNLVEGLAGSEEGAEIGIDIEGEVAAVEVAGNEEAPAEDGDEAARSALLLYQEGTAEEQIYPFPGDVLTVGRGRDNDIQIKNDSKVSRFHCKLFRRGANFYIEDNKSSNGTLVNGELITERRLFGGEEVIIGETFFRFRIM